MSRVLPGKPRRSGRAVPLVLALALVPAVTATEAVADGLPMACLNRGGVEAAAGAGYGGIWLSPPVGGVQRINVALVTGTDEEPVRAAVRACGAEQRTDLRPAAYPLSAVRATQDEFGRRLGAAFGASGLVSYATSVRDDRFVVSLTLRLDATDAQVAALQQLATSVSADSGVPIVFAEQRGGIPSPAGGDATAPPRPEDAFRIVTTSGSRRQALRTGVVRLGVSNVSEGTTITLKTASGRRIVVGRADAAARKGLTVVRIPLTAAGRKRLRSVPRLRLTVVLASDTVKGSQSLLLR